MRFMSNEQHRPIFLSGQRRLALVIGVNSSASTSLVPLQYAERDAALMAEVLQTRCDFELFKPTLLGNEASTDAVRNAVIKLSLQAEKDDLLLFYFSGHGQQMSIEAGMQSTYLVTANFDEQIVEVDNNAHLSLPWLRENLLLKTKAERVLIILDCCFAEDIRTPPDRYLEELQQRIAYYFDMPGSNEGTRRSGLCVALAAAGYDQNAGEQNGAGIMTGLLLKALSGEEDDVLGNDGNITVNRLTEYIKESMPQQQKPAISKSDTGGYEYILAQYPERAAELYRLRHHTPVVNERPHSYTPESHKDTFQPRPGEFETLERLLLPPQASNASSLRVALVGVIGMGGIGKTQLAAEFAHRYKERFAAGIFWMSAIGTTLLEWQRQFADLAEKTDYLRGDDDITNPENEARRARHMCRYLASNANALLILDNVENTDFVLTALSSLAGIEARCTILYTSRNTVTPHGVKRHVVERLPEDGALHLLLTHKPALLPLALQENTSDPQAKAARAICQYVDYLPLALTLLRDLLQDDYLTLSHIAEQLQQRGAFEITRDFDETEARLFTTFLLSWNKITDLGAQHLFKLAAYFPEATAIPLWLLGLAAGLGETGNTRLEPLGRARTQLQRWSMIEVLTDEQIRLHPLIREFGRQLVTHDEQGNKLLQEAGQHLVNEFTNINKLEQRAFAVGYWRCLEQVQQAYQYAQILDANNIETLERLEQWLARDSSLLGTDEFWPEKMPGLFYQLLHNHFIEAGYQVPATRKQAARWIRQLEQVGIEDDTLLREFKHPDSVTCVSYSPDGRTIATGCEDGVARLWDVASGRTLIKFRGHTDGIFCLAFSPDGTKIATGSDDATTRIWDVTNGTQLHLLRGSVQALHSVAFSPNGERLVTTSEDGIGRVWDVASGEETATLSKRDVTLTYTLFTPDSEKVVSCSLYNVFLWDVRSETIVKVLEEEVPGQRVHRLFLLKNQIIVVGSEQIDKYPDLDSNITEIKTKVWNVESREILAEIPEPESEGSVTSNIIDTAISPDSTKLIITLGERLIRMWNMKESTTTINLARHAGRITSIDFSPHNNTIITGSEDRTARLWSMINPQMLAIASSAYNLTKIMSFSHDGTKLVLLNMYGQVNLCDTQTRWRTAIKIDTLSHVNSISFSPDDTSIVSGLHDGIKVFDALNGGVQLDISNISETIKPSPINTPEVNDVCFSPDCTIIVSSDTHHKIQLRDAVQGNKIAQLEGHRGGVHHLVFSPDGTRLVSGSDDGTARIWNMTDYTTIAILKDHVGGVTSLCISPDSTLMATASLDGVVHIWSMQDGKALAMLKGRRVATSNMAFSPDGSLLLVNDCYAYTSLWKMDRQGNGQLVGTYKTASEIKAIHWQDTRHIILAGIDGSGYEPQFYHLALEGEW